MQVRCEQFPRGRFYLAKTGKAVDAIAQPPTQCVIAEIDAVHRDDRKLGGEAAILREVEEGWNQLAPRQVTSAAENDEDGRIELFGGF